uniref:Uncharacterized protein n=1 Tax=Anopheles dirus TaxID=7168 RepID=A0A182NE46_9DIPT
MSFTTLHPVKKQSIGDMYLASMSPYGSTSFQEMGHYIQEARKLTRNNTFIGLNTCKNDDTNRTETFMDTWTRCNSAEHLPSNRQNRSNPTAFVKQVVGSVPSVTAPISDTLTRPNEFDLNDCDYSEVKEKHPMDRRCSMIPVICHSAIVRQKPPVQSPISEKEKTARRKPAIPPKVPAKHQNSIKIFRAERLQDKNLDMAQQFDELREQIALMEQNRKREEQQNREIFDLLRSEIHELKSICNKLVDTVEHRRNAEYDMFLKMKHAEFSLYSRSCEVSKKILSNTFGRRRKSNTAHATFFNPNGDTIGNTGDKKEGNGNPCSMEDAICNPAHGLVQSDGTSGGAGDCELRRASSVPDTPLNIVTSVYYVSEMQSVEMEDDAPQANNTENQASEALEKELGTKKKSGLHKIGYWFKSGKN